MLKAKQKLLIWPEVRAGGEAVIIINCVNVFSLPQTVIANHSL